MVSVCAKSAESDFLNLMKGNTMFEKTRIAQAILVSLGGVAVSAGAQTQQVEKIEITGSSIKRIDAESSLPVTVIKREDIEKLGATSAAEIIERISANSGQGYSLSGAIGDSARPGFAGASLRGLGSTNTLILLNGRRLAVNGFDGGGVNLGAIPSAALERIEILRDGASAIYGTDAVAGVINFITRKDFKGGLLDLGYYQPQAKGGKSQQFTATIGFGDLGKDNFNFMGVVDFRTRDNIRAADRPYGSSAYLTGVDIEGGVIDNTSGNAFPSNVFIPGVGNRNPFANLYQNGNGCAPPVSFGYTPTSSQCRFDYASVIDIWPSAENTTFFGRGNYRLNANHQLFAEYSYAKQEYIFRISPTPVSAATTFNNDPVLLYPTSQYYPTAWLQQFFPSQAGQPISLFWRAIAVGPRTSQADIEEDRLLVGANGTIGAWDYGVGLNTSRSKAVESYPSGQLSEQRTIAAFATGLVNPFGAQTAEGQALLDAAQVIGPVRNSKSTRDTIDAKISRELFQLPAGAVAVALGGEYRKEKFNDIPAAVLGAGDIIGGGGNQEPVVGSRSVTALFTEVSVPILKSLEAQLAVRHDRYSDFGNTTNPKLGLRFQPVQQALLRASFNTGFRAPTLPETFAVITQTNTGNAVNDPFYDAHTGCDNIFDPVFCNAQLTVRQGGNRNLKPEKSRSFTIGALIEPTRDISIGVDYFQIKQRDLIGIPSADGILSDFIDNFNPATLTSTSSDADKVFTRLVNGKPVIDYILATFNNFGDQVTEGLDISLKAKLPRSNFGTVSLGLEGTILLKQKTKDVGATEFGDNLVGTYLNSFGPLPRLRYVASADWERGPFSSALTYIWQQGYTDAELSNTQDANGDYLPRKVKPYALVNLSGTYSGIKNLKLTAGVLNLFDKDPPFSNQTNTFQVGYDPSYSDPRGRTFYLRASYKFF
jgi:iron complex outermembrane recepter protein